MFHFAVRTLTLLIAANLADSPTKGVLWALPRRERSHLLVPSLIANVPSARNRAGRQHRRAIVPYLVATELNCFTSDGTPARLGALVSSCASGLGSLDRADLASTPGVLSPVALAHGG